MNATATSLTPRLRVRAAGAAIAVLITLGVVSGLAQSLHVERLGEGAQVVHLERITVTAQRPAAAPAVAVIAAPSRTN